MKDLQEIRMSFLDKPKKIITVLERLNESVKSKKLFRLIAEQPGLGSSMLSDLMKYKNTKSVREYRNLLEKMKIIEIKRKGREMHHYPTPFGSLVHESLVSMDYENALSMIYEHLEKAFVDEFPSVENTKKWSTRDIKSVLLDVDELVEQAIFAFLKKKFLVK